MDTLVSLICVPGCLPADLEEEGDEDRQWESWRPNEAR